MKAYNQRHRVHQSNGMLSGNVGEPKRAQQDRSQALTSPSRAKSQAGERDPHLNAGHHPVQLANQLQNNLRPKSALIHQLSHARQPHRDQ